MDGRDFALIWADVIEVCRSAGVCAEDSVGAGKLEEPRKAPFIWVYCLPAPALAPTEGAFTSADVIDLAVDCEIYCGALAASTAQEAIVQSYSMAIAVAQAVAATFRALFPSDAIRFDAVYSDKAVTCVRFRLPGENYRLVPIAEQEAA